MDPTTDSSTSWFDSLYGTSATDSSSSAAAPSQSSWSGLDSLGSAITGVASNILSSAGNLVAAQVNNAALLQSTGAVTKPLTNAPTTSANKWTIVVIVGAVALVGVAIIAAVKRK